MSPGMVYRTLVFAEGEFPGGLLEKLAPVWQSRLGEGVLALEVVSGGVQEVVPGLERLLAQQRALALIRRGYQIDPAVHLVLLGEAHEPGLVAAIEAIRTHRGVIPFAGLEFQMHLLVFLPDLLRPPPKPGWDACRRLLAADSSLQPNEEYPLRLRVWFVSRRNEEDLCLQNPQEVEPVVQHFVEACVIQPLHLRPMANGLTCGVLGAARFQLERPSVESVAKRLWAELKGRGRQTPSIKEICSEGAVPPCSLHVSDLPQRTSCAEYPQWPQPLDGTEVEETSYRKQVEDEAAQMGSVAGDYVQQALRAGLASFQKVRQALEEALRQARAEWVAALEPFDERKGVQVKRARLARLQRESETQGREEEPPELQSLREELEQLDRTIRQGEIEEFFHADRQVASLEQGLRDLQKSFEENRARWEEAKEHRRRLDAENVPLWTGLREAGKRVWSWITAWFAPSKATPPPEASTKETATQPGGEAAQGPVEATAEDSAEGTTQGSPGATEQNSVEGATDQAAEAARTATPQPPLADLDEREVYSLLKETCDRAWKLLGEAQVLREQYAQIRARWLERWARVLFAEAQVRRLEREMNTWRQIAKVIESVCIEEPEPTVSALVLPVSGQSLTAEQIDRAVRRLWETDFAGVLLQADAQAIVRLLREEAGRLLAEMPVGELSRLLDERYWEMAVAASAPRAVVHSAPQHERQGYVFGATPDCLPNVCVWQADPDWYPGEVVMLRARVGLQPGEILELTRAPELLTDGEDSVGDRTDRIGDRSERQPDNGTSQRRTRRSAQ